MKELYIRKGNSEETRNVLIIGEEQFLGGRDISGYRPSKGAIFKPIKKVDPYSKNKGLTYIHATPNILLDNPNFSRDYDIHSFIKEDCKDLVKWDGEATEGLVASREAFLVPDNKNVDKVALELYKRIELVLHGKYKKPKKFLKNLFKLTFQLILLVPRILGTLVVLLFVKNKRKKNKYLKSMWKFN